MPFLVVNSETVPVAVNQTKAEMVEVGDRARAFDGTMMSTIRARKNEWEIQTAPMTRANADTLETALRGTAPLTCSGDLLGGSTQCHVMDIEKRFLVGGPTGDLVVLFFTLQEE